MDTGGPQLMVEHTPQLCPTKPFCTPRRRSAVHFDRSPGSMMPRYTSTSLALTNPRHPGGPRNSTVTRPAVDGCHRGVFWTGRNCREVRDDHGVLGTWWNRCSGVPVCLTGFCSLGHPKIVHFVWKPNLFVLERQPSPRGRSTWAVNMINHGSTKTFNVSYHMSYV